MDIQKLINYLDEIVFKNTEKHLDSLQLSILKGVLKGQKYSEIAQDYKCTPGHAKDEAYKLWHILSKALGEEINKSNFRAKVERLGVANSQYQIIGNPVQVGNIHLCNNPLSTDSNSELFDKKSDSTIVQDDTNDIQFIQRSVKLETVPKLAKLGLSTEQIAQALDLSIDEVKQVLN